MRCSSHGKSSCLSISVLQHRPYGVLASVVANHPLRALRWRKTTASCRELPQHGEEVGDRDFTSPLGALVATYSRVNSSILTLISFSILLLGIEA